MLILILYSTLLTHSRQILELTSFHEKRGRGNLESKSIHKTLHLYAPNQLYKSTEQKFIYMLRENRTRLTGSTVNRSSFQFGFDHKNTEQLN